MSSVYKFNSLGETVSGAEVISQAAQLLIGVQQGEVAHFPDFGSNVEKYIEQPVSVAIPGINNEIVLALQDLPEGATLKQIVPPDGYSDLQSAKYSPTLIIEWNQQQVESGNII